MKEYSSTDIKNRTNSRFISTFVNELYAILLGIGMGSIVLREGFELTDIFGLVSAVFVVVVVAVYWWDWVDAIEDQAQGSQREFLIDLSMGFVFLMLFAFYDQPMVLAVLFVALSCLDFVWVINSCYESACIGVVLPSKIVGAVLRKLFAIAFFLVLYIALRFFAETLLPTFQFVAVVSCFMIVRALCFTHVGQIRAAILRKAERADIEQIVGIHNSHVNRHKNSTQEDGFLLKKTSAEEVETKLDNSSQVIYVAVNAKNDILGFVEVTDVLPQDEVSNVSWNSNEIREKFFNGTHCHILCVAVAHKYIGKGCGQMIYRSLRERFPKVILSAFIVTLPIPNKQSLAFHLKKGFEKVAVFSKAEFQGLQDYQSVLVANFPAE